MPVIAFDQDITDLEVRNEGTLWTFRPVSNAGRAFIREHAPEDASYFGSALVVEHRYAETWIQGALEEGLALS